MWRTSDLQGDKTHLPQRIYCAFVCLSTCLEIREEISVSYWKHSYLQNLSLRVYNCILFCYSVLLMPKFLEVLLVLHSGITTERFIKSLLSKALNL